MFLSLLLITLVVTSPVTPVPTWLQKQKVSSFDCTQDYALCTELCTRRFYWKHTQLDLGALFRNCPPVGRPDVVLVQIENPEIGLDQNYSIELHPITASGDYHLYVSLYMEGGGEWLPSPASIII